MLPYVLTYSEECLLYDVRQLTLPERQAIFATARALREQHEFSDTPSLQPANVVSLRRTI